MVATNLQYNYVLSKKRLAGMDVHAGKDRFCDYFSFYLFQGIKAKNLYTQRDVLYIDRKV